MQMAMEKIIYAFTAGIGLGWVAIPHCAAMCGPLHLAVCAINRSSAAKAGLLFNIGKIAGYTLAGALLGWLGSFLSLSFPKYCPHCGSDKPAYLLYLFPGILFLIMSISSFLKMGLHMAVPPFVARLFTGPKKKSLIMLGGLTALLPCGMLYIAFASAMTLASPIAAAIFLFTFSFTIAFSLQIGTLLGRFIDRKYSRLFERCFPWLTFVGGIVYILLFLKTLFRHMDG